MGETYFLGANSRAGFRSLYRDFTAAPGEVLHVIKGGPGTGKSGFMRRIAQAAEERGLETELVLCSGDPDSLDGVYIPALRQGWADGTAPHVLDPAHFGADGDYVDLGRFCRPLAETDRARVIALSRAYKERYAEAYRWLAAAGALHEAGAPKLPDEAEEKLRRRIRGILRREGGREAGIEKRRWLSAISCRGLLRLPLPERCQRVITFGGRRGFAPEALSIAAEEAALRGLDRILCLSPLDEREAEALLLPGAGLAFLAGERGAAGTRTIRTDTLTPPDAEERRRRHLALRAEHAALDEATGLLARAKALHDELEAVYRPYMDFAALTAFTDETVERIFSS